MVANQVVILTEKFNKLLDNYPPCPFVYFLRYNIFYAYAYNNYEHIKKIKEVIEKFSSNYYGWSFYNNLDDDKLKKIYIELRLMAAVPTSDFIFRMIKFAISYHFMIGSKDKQKIDTYIIKIDKIYGLYWFNGGNDNYDKKLFESGFLEIAKPLIELYISILYIKSIKDNKLLEYCPTINNLNKIELRGVDIKLVQGFYANENNKAMVILACHFFLNETYIKNKDKYEKTIQHIIKKELENKDYTMSEMLFKMDIKNITAFIEKLFAQVFNVAQ